MWYYFRFWHKKIEQWLGPQYLLAFINNTLNNQLRAYFEGKILWFYKFFECPLNQNTNNLTLRVQILLECYLVSSVSNVLHNMIHVHKVTMFLPSKFMSSVVISTVYVWINICFLGENPCSNFKSEHQVSFTLWIWIASYVSISLFGIDRKQIFSPNCLLFLNDGFVLLFLWCRVGSVRHSHILYVTVAHSENV